MTDQSLLAIPLSQMMEMVFDAFVHYPDLVWLADSPLADCSATAAAMMPASAPQNINDTGRAVRAVLGWLVKRTAPAPPECPLGAQRSVDDPTWSHPRWWHYNTLRHQYLEPLVPAGQSDLQLLLRLTRITSRSKLQSVRRQGI